MIFSFEKERSALATVTGNVMNNKQMVVSPGKDGIKFVVCNFCKISVTVAISRMSFLKYAVNWRSSLSKSTSSEMSPLYNFKNFRTPDDNCSLELLANLEGWMKLKTLLTIDCPANRPSSCFNATSRIMLKTVMRTLSSEFLSLDSVLSSSKKD